MVNNAIELEIKLIIVILNFAHVFYVMSSIYWFDTELKNIKHVKEKDRI